MKKLYTVPRAVAFANRHLFDPGSGFHAIDLADDMLLLCAEFQNEYQEETWCGTKGVERLPEPVFEGKKTMKERKFPKRHWNALRSIGILETDTILEVSKKASEIHPLVRIRHIG